jgi:hypothetical protein
VPEDSKNPVPLIFTPERIKRAQRLGRTYTGSIIDRLIVDRDKSAAGVRAQLERIAARVPTAQRARVLGQLDSRSADGTIDQLLLGATLQDLGWEVEHEPLIDGRTPDFLVRKKAAEFVIEVARVERKGTFEACIARIREAFEPYRTSRPISIDEAEVDGTASLKGLIQHVLALSDAPPSLTEGEFREPGVFVAYEVFQKQSEPKRLLWAWPSVEWENYADAIRARIRAKSKAYKRPLIVAVDLAGIADAFEDARLALYGSLAFSVPVWTGDLPRPAEAAAASIRHLPDGPLNAPGSEGRRARERLLGVLPFERGLREDHFFINAALLGTFQTTREQLAPFQPIPYCVPTSSDESGVRMAWFGEGGKPLEDPEWMRWTWTPARGE